MKTKELMKIAQGAAERIAKGIEARRVPFYGNVKPAFIPIEKMVHKKAENEIEKRFQSQCDELITLSVMMGKPVQELGLYKRYVAEWQNLSSGDSELAKAMTRGVDAAGGYWVPTAYSNELVRMVELARVSIQQIRRFPMPYDPYRYPTKTGRSTAYKVAEGATVTGSTPATGYVELSTSKLMDYVNVSYELEEDSIIPILPTVNEDLANSLARGETNAFINGDTDGSLDSDNTTATDQRRTYDGLRELAVANGWTRSLATFNSVTLASMIADMGVYGATKADLMWIVGTKVDAKLLNLKDDQNNRVALSADATGNTDAWEKGQTFKMFGIPVFTEEQMREDLNASGKYDGTTTTKAGILLVYKPGFIIGQRRGITLEQDKVIKAQTIDLVGSMRVDFKPKFAIASNRIVNYGINITP